mmetsp:Transcript_13196/g.52881  ORF Transcript_13196/g.52881 Transcript_13196/m.52881 type:complete len:257 (-) Transcript_13196:810-1580(-)
MMMARCRSSRGATSSTAPPRRSSRTSATASPRAATPAASPRRSSRGTRARTCTGVAPSTRVPERSTSRASTAAASSSRSSRSATPASRATATPRTSACAGSPSRCAESATRCSGLETTRAFSRERPPSGALVRSRTSLPPPHAAARRDRPSRCRTTSAAASRVATGVRTSPSSRTSPGAPGSTSSSTTSTTPLPPEVEFSENSGECYCGGDEERRSPVDDVTREAITLVCCYPLLSPMCGASHQTHTCHRPYVPRR